MMDGRERLLTALRGERADRVPVAPFLYFNSGYEMKPNAIPSAIDQANGIPIMTRKAGNASVKSLQSMLRTFRAIRLPTTIRAGAVIG